MAPALVILILRRTDRRRERRGAFDHLRGREVWLGNGQRVVDLLSDLLHGQES
jgi:hypothetical protein